MHIPFFRIFYSTTFTIFSLLLAALLLITPIDQTYQAFHKRQFYNIVIIASVHLLTLVVAVFLYASRLFTNRTILANIPKVWSPVEKGDVEKRVRLLVAENLKRSAVIAYEAHPRDLSKERENARDVQSLPGGQAQEDNEPDKPPIPVWGIISHPGWSSPSSPDLPNLHYDPVIFELSHLIEAKAVSLVPPDPLSIPSPISDTSSSPLPDALAVELLQRPATMGLRDYISHLTSLGMINPPELGSDFCALYEKARFSTRPLAEPEFRTLMNIFAEILRKMKDLDPEIIAELHAEQDAISDLSSFAGADGESLESSATVQHTRRPDVYQAESPPSSSQSRRGSQATVHTAPSSPHRQRDFSTSPAVSGRDGFHTPSLASLRPVKSHASSMLTQRSGGSVIRLAEARGPLDLPYTILNSSGEPIS